MAIKKPLKKQKKKTKKTKQQSESAIQREYFRYIRCRRATNWKYEFIHSIPYGIRATIGLAMKIKAEGLTEGIPDVCVPCPSQGYHVMYLEFKTRYGQQSKAQKRFQKYCKMVGNKYVVVRSAIDAIRVTEEYLTTSTVTRDRLER